MNQQWLDLATRRGELTTRIAMQREQLAANVTPLQTVLDVADQGAAGLRWIKARPAWVAGGVTLLVVLKPTRLWRWGRRAWMVGQGVRRLRHHLQGLL